MTEPIRIFIGYDRRMPVTSHVMAHSITSRASQPVSITFLNIANLRSAGLMTRPLVSNQSTEFSFSRFLTPYLAGYQGWALFVDNDMVVLDDIAKLYDLRDSKYAVMCVQHDHRPTNTVKFLGEQQTRYEMKNWSSVMLMDCSKCTALTPDYVNTASGLELHRFKWLDSPDLIGALPPEWNHLVEYSPGALEDQKLLHYTDGGPYYSAYRDCKWADVWTDERDSMLAAIEASLGEVFPGEVVEPA